MFRTIKELYNEYIRKHGVAPCMVDVNVQFHDDGTIHFYTIALFKYDSEKVPEHIDEKIFYYCNDGIIELEQLQYEDKNVDFHIIPNLATIFY